MPDFIEQLRGRLVKLSCPIAHIRRLVREVADHREDLKHAGLAEGLSEAEAEARADASLGDPLVLAEQTMMTVRRSSWWGRHYVVAFGLLPVLAYPMLWFLLLTCELLLAAALGYGWDWKKLHAAANNPVTFHHLLLAFHFMDYLAIALVTLLFCWLARRAAVKLKWMVVSCAICSLLAVLSRAKFEPHSVTAGAGMTLNQILTIELVALLCSLLARKMPLILKWGVVCCAICSVLALIIFVKTGPHSFSVSAGENSQPVTTVAAWFRGTIPLLVAGATYAVQRWTIRHFQREATLS